MKLVLIWEAEEDVKTSFKEFHRKMKPVKLNGRKPTKIVVHDTDDKPINEKLLKSLVSYDGLVISTTGRAVYDGRKKRI